MTADEARAAAVKRLPNYPAPADLGQVLELFADGTAYGPEPPMRAIAAPQPTQELLDWLHAQGTLPGMRVTCICPYRLGKWRIEGGFVMPDFEPGIGFERTGALPYTELIRARKGNIYFSATHDGRGTFGYLCPKCKAKYPLRTESRMELYLKALLLNSRTVQLPAGKLGPIANTPKT